MRHALVLAAFLCNFAISLSQEKKPIYQQQFSQQFLDTLETAPATKPEKTTFSFLDTLYLQKQSEQNNQTAATKIDYTPLYYGLAIGAAVIWIIYKVHQSLSSIAGERISDFVFGKLFTGLYNSCYWLVRQAVVDAYGIVKKIFEYSIAQGLS